MSVKMSDQVWRTLDVRGAEKILLLHFADICNDQGDGIFASDEYSSWKCDVPPRTIQFYRRRWREMGAFVAVGRMELSTGRRELSPNPTIGRGWVMLYRLDLSPFPRKASWEEIKKGATIATFPETTKVARSNNKGRKIHFKRSQKRAAHIRKIREVKRECNPSVAERPPLRAPELIPEISEKAVSLFGKAYEEYPRHVGRRSAEKAWTAAVRRHSEKGEAFIFEQVRAYAAASRQARTEQQYIPHLATWLNGDRFLDDIDEWLIRKNSKPQRLMENAARNFCEVLRARAARRQTEAV